MKIQWTRVTESGLCDRLSDVLLVSAYARCKNATLHMGWPHFPARDIDTQHRRVDILLENILQFMRFPVGTYFDQNGDTPFNFYLGGGVTAEDFHRQHLTDFCGLNTYLDAVKQVGTEFGFCEAIQTYLTALPSKFVTFHIRRGDKVRHEQHDGCFIRYDELDMLNDMTRKAIDYFMREKGYNTFFVCGDEVVSKQVYIDYIQSKGATVFTVPPMELWQATYYDIAVMTKAEFNITSQRYSSFSRFPSLIGVGLFNTVFNLKNDGVLV